MPGLFLSVPPFPLEYSPFDPTCNLVEGNMKWLENRGLKAVVFGATFTPSEWNGILECVPFTTWGLLSLLEDREL